MLNDSKECLGRLYMAFLMTFSSFTKTEHAIDLLRLSFANQNTSGIKTNKNEKTYNYYFSLSCPASRLTILRRGCRL